MSSPVDVVAFPNADGDGGYDDSSSIGSASSDDDDDQRLDGQDGAENKGVTSSSSSSSPPSSGLSSLGSLTSLEDSLPIKRGLSNHYIGRSRSFASLSQCGDGSAADLVKPDNPYNKRRRIQIRSRISYRRRASCGAIVELPPLREMRGANHEEEEEEEEDAVVREEGESDVSSDDDDGSGMRARMPQVGKSESVIFERVDNLEN